jgi:hypothetical protein
MHRKLDVLSWSGLKLCITRLDGQITDIRTTPMGAEDIAAAGYRKPCRAGWSQEQRGLTHTGSCHRPASACSGLKKSPVCRST